MAVFLGGPTADCIAAEGACPVAPALRVESKEGTQGARRRRPGFV